MNELQIILVVTITETYQIIYTTAAVITEILGYKMNSDMEQTSPWRRRLKANIKAALREVSQLLELQKGAMKKMLRKYRKLKRYTREIEGRRINQLYSDIGMSVRLEKCSQMETKRVKVVRTEGIAQPEGKIADTEDSFRCLGIPQANGNHSLR